MTGLFSFLCGALAWHLVGFWSFVSAIVYNPDPEHVAMSAPEPIAHRQAATTTLPPTPPPPAAVRNAKAHATGKATSTITGANRPPANANSLAELLQCAEARKGGAETIVHACPPLRRRLPMASAPTRGNRQLDAREAARRLANGWQTGIATIETGSLPDRR